MIKSRVRTMVSSINHLFDLLPEPLVLRAMEEPQAGHRTKR
jgi:hypothetical protein